MSVQSVSITPSTNPELHPTPDTRLHGHWRFVVPAISAVVTGVAIILFLAGIPVSFAFWRTVCAQPPCVIGQILPVDAQTLHTFGLSLTFYAAYRLALNLVLATVFTASSFVIVLRKPDDWLALFVGVMLVTFGTFTFSDIMDGLTAAYPTWAAGAHLIAWFGDVTIMLFLFTFPSGRFAPRWTRFIPLFWGILQGCRWFLPATPLNLKHSVPFLYNLFFLTGILGGLMAQVYRYRCVSGPTQRQQTRWIVFSVAIALGGFLLLSFPFRAFEIKAYLPVMLAVSTIQVLLIVLIPISIAVAVLRYRLWEIDPLINRTLVYVMLTVSVIALYVVIVGALGALFQNRGNFTISVLATGVAAVLFEPLRKRLQRNVNRLMYGERDDPYAVLSRLGRRLENNLAPDAVLPTIVETVAQALKLPYVGIAVANDYSSPMLTDTSIRAEWRRNPVVTPDPSSLFTLPLIYQGETLGELRLASRAPGEPFEPADQNLLADLAHQAGVAVHAVRLTYDLQRSREQLVTAREEERRRLRRDLHDGLGPQLASQALKLEAVRDLIRTRPERAEQIVEELIAKSQETIADVRRVVYALRPPALDEFGLLGAISEYARQSETNGTRIMVNAGKPLPPLPAAVEVAAYHIVQEALTNVVRHAQAHTVEVRLEFTDLETALYVVIEDDGSGLPPVRHAGVGLHSMRERAAELGGDCQLEAGAAGGTRVFAQLPLNGKKF